MKKLFLLIIPIVFCCLMLSFSFNMKNDAEYANAVVQNTFPTVIIDAGHGGFDGGASTFDGYLEKDINLSVSLYLKEYLDLFGFNTILTRDCDNSLEDEGLSTIRKKKVSDIHNRLELMKKTDNSVFLSIHQNHFSIEKYNGMQVFYSKKYSDVSSLLAQNIQEATVEMLQTNNERQIKECGTSVYLIYNAEKPACLVECGFLSNLEEAEKLKTPEYQKKIAYCIAIGVQKYFYYKD